MLNMLVGIYIGIAIMGAIVAAIAGLSAPVAAPKTNIARAPAPTVPEEKVATAPASLNRPVSLIAGLKKRFNLWQTRIHKKKVIVSPSPPPSNDASEELPATGGIVIPEPGAAAPDLLENMPPLPLGREKPALAPATEEPDVREKVVTAPASPNRPASLIAGLKKRFNLWQTRIRKKKVIVSPSPPPSIDASEELPATGGIVIPEPGAAAPDLLENMPPLPLLGRESLAPAPATEEPDTNVPDTPVAPVPEMTTEETVEGGEPEPDVPGIAPITVDSAVPDDEPSGVAASEMDVTDSSSGEPTPEEVPFTATDEAETEIALPELADIELPLGILNDQQISEDVTDSSPGEPIPEEVPVSATDEAEPEIALPELADIELPSLGILNDQQVSEEESEMNMPDGNEGEPVEVAAEDQSPEESEEAGESSDDEKDKKKSSGSSIFDLFTEEVVEESDTSKFAATLDNVDVLDLLKEAQNFKNTLDGTQG